MESSSRNSIRNLALILLTILVYFVAARIGLLLAFKDTNISPVWPPSGIALSFILLFGYVVSPGIAIGAFLANFLTQLPFLTSLSISMGNTLEALIGAYIIRRMVRDSEPLERPKSIFYFLLACMLSCAVAATIGTTAVYLIHRAVGTSYSYLWSTWWLGDTTGMMIVAPFLLSWMKKEQRTPGQQPLMALLIFGGIVITAWIVFGGLLPGTASVTYLTLPLLIIAAFRFEQRGASAGVLLLSALAVWGTHEGYGPFYKTDMNESLLFLQLFMGVITATTLLVAGAVTEQKDHDRIIRQQLKEKDVLMKEVHHRVKNNLQLVISLLRLQSFGADPPMQKFLTESQNRLQSMALIHERLYGRDVFGHINMASYLQDITSFLLASYTGQAEHIQLDLKCEGVFLPMDQAIPCGLIVNEVITNSLKYAFPENDGGRILIQFSQRNQQNQLNIQDNGVGFNRNALRPSEASSLGLRLIELLVDQLGGKLEIDTTQGASFSIRF